MKAIVTLIIVAVLGVGTSAAANSSKPGDLLYPIKVNINEKARVTLSGTLKSKGDLEIKYAERRLIESIELAIDNLLNGNVSADLEANFLDYANSIEERIVKISLTNPEAAAELAGNFYDSLITFEKVLAEMEVKADSESERLLVASIRQKVALEAGEVLTLKTQIETQIVSEDNDSVREAAEGKLGAAENKIAEVKKYIELKESQLGAAATSQAKIELAIAEQKVADGKAKIESQAYAEAFQLFKEAHSVAQQAKKLVELNLQFNTRVRVDLDDEDEDEEIDEDDEDADEDEGDDSNDDDDEDEDGDDKNINANLNANVNLNVNAQIGL